MQARLEEFGSPYAQILSTALALVATEQAREEWDPAAEKWQVLSLPAQGAFTIEFESLRVDPVQAEYDRRVSVAAPGASKVIVDLPRNSGGRTHFDVFWIQRAQNAGPWLRLLDHTGEYMVLLNPPTLQRICRDGVQLTHVAADSCARSGSEGNLQYDGKAGAPPKYYPGVYLGAIDGRDGPHTFRSAKEAPQGEIRQPFPEY